MPDRRSAGFVFAAGAIIAAAVLAGCSSPVEAELPEMSAPVPTVSELVGDWRIVGFDADPVDEVIDFTSFSEAGVIGVVAEFTPGELVTNDPLGSSEYLPVLLRIDDVQVVSGELTESAGSVFVTLPGTLAAEEYANNVPVGTPVVAYINDITSPGGKVGMTLKSGAPEGTTIYTVTHPSGLAFEFGRDGAAVERSASPDQSVLVFPLESAVAEKAGVDQLVPGEPVPEFIEP
nr:hypothetical protein [Microbacterium hydrocarbonoxydans]